MTNFPEIFNNSNSREVWIFAGGIIIGFASHFLVKKFLRFFILAAMIIIGYYIYRYWKS